MSNNDIKIITNLINKEIKSESDKNYIVLGSITDGTEGANGILLKVKEVESNSQFAMKILKTTSKNKEDRFLDEYQFQHESTNAYLVKALDKGIVKLSNNSNKKYPFYIMNIYDCNYRYIIKNNKTEFIFDNEKKIKYILQLCKALKYMHNKKVIHRDLKPENILYDKKLDKVLIGDLGIAHFNQSNKTVSEDQMGNFDYHAPEQKKNGTKVYGTYTDIYSLGLIINESFTDEIPCGTNYKKVSDVYPPFSFLDDIISTMLIQNPSLRENNINVIINKINIELKNLIFFKDDILNKIQFELEDNGKKISKQCKKQIFNDLSIANNFYQNNIISSENINRNYHCNISYNLIDYIFNAYINYEIYQIVSNKFFYEAGTGIINDDPIDLVEDADLINKYDLILNKYKAPREFNHYSKKSKKLFVNLKKYHAIEVFNQIENCIDIAKRNLFDAPLLWIYFFLCDKKFINELKSAYDDYTICDLIEFNINRINENIEFNNLYDENKSRTKEFMNSLKKLFHSLTIINNEKFTLNKRDYNLLMNYYETNFKDDGSVTCGDIIDFFQNIEEINNEFQCKLELCQIEPLKKFLLKSSNIKFISN